MKIAGLYVSPGHNFFGHHGLPPGEHPMVRVEAVECVAGQGLRGDRFFGHGPDYPGQITFFAEETHLALCRELGAAPAPPSVYRRNVIARGVDLARLFGQEFTVQGVRFLGGAECKPCHWMDRAVGPGAEAWLRGRGGLRAKILSDGWLRVDCATAAGVLLAGGRARRMGCDKATMPWGDRTLGEHQAAKLAASGAWPLRLACRREQRWTPRGFIRIEDEDAHGGALAALVGAGEKIEATVLVVLAVDLPLVPVDLLIKLTRAASEAGMSVVPVRAGRFEPLAAAWHRSAWPALRAALAAGQPLQQVCAALQAAGRLRPHALARAETQWLTNLNTPADWKRGRRQAGLPALACRLLASDSPYRL